MANKITLYHGSQQRIEKPLFGYGNVHNDYGLGFYCTQMEDLACEWACTAESGGFADAYVLDIMRGRWQNDDPRLQRVVSR